MKRLAIFIFLIFILFSLFNFWWKNGTSAIDPFNKKQNIFVIQKGQSVRDIANKLKREGLIKDPIIFFLLIKRMGLEGKIQAGDFRLSPSMTPEEIATALTHGTLDLWVTIPEGKRAEEIAEILAKNLPFFDASWKKVLIENEGYLFPDTYLIPKDTDINFVVSMLKNNFESKFSKLNINPAKKNEIVIIASLIEREAKFKDDLPLVSSVIHNRLNIDMALQIDATIQYALGYQISKKTWWRILIADDLKIDSLYNTYKKSGLPPTPIANPGFSALEAAAFPTKTDYLYYISDKLGHNHYAKTLEEHNRNIQKYGL